MYGIYIYDFIVIKIKKIDYWLVLKLLFKIILSKNEVMGNKFVQNNVIVYLPLKIDIRKNPENRNKKITRNEKFH